MKRNSKTPLFAKTGSPSCLRFLVGKNEQIIEVHVSSADHSKGTHHLEAHVLGSAPCPILTTRDSLNGAQVHKLHTRKAVAL